MPDVVGLLQHLRDEGFAGRVIIDGSPRDKHVQVLVDHLVIRLDRPSHIIHSRDATAESVRETAAEAEEGDVVVLAFDPVNQPEPDVLRAYDEVIQRARFRKLTVIIVGQHPPDAAREYADAVVTPRIVGDATMLATPTGRAEDKYELPLDPLEPVGGT